MEQQLIDSIRDWRWFHNNMTPEKASNILSINIQGSYLLRESASKPSRYCFSVNHPSIVKHYRLYIKYGYVSLDRIIQFSNIQELIEYYKTEDYDGIFLSQPVCDYNSLESNLEKLHLIIPPGDLQLGEYVNKGEHSEIYEGSYKSKTVAVKKMLNMDLDKDHLYEANIMAMLENNNLLKLIGVVLDKDVCLVLEYMEEGSLLDYLRSRGRDIKQEWQLSVIEDICAGMVYLESKNIVHCDLAARNILISKHFKIKISDFGLSKPNGTKDSKNKFPVRWTAPEAITSRVFTHKCDVWSYGVVLWEIVSFGKIPYSHVPSVKISSYINEGNRLVIPNECLLPLRSIIENTWNINPSERKSFDEIYQNLVFVFGTYV